MRARASAGGCPRPPRSFHHCYSKPAYAKPQHWGTNGIRLGIVGYDILNYSFLTTNCFVVHRCAAYVVVP